MVLTRGHFLYCERESRLGFLTSLLRGSVEFMSRLAACGASRVIVALLAAGLLVNSSARAQSQTRPADFKVKIVLLPSSWRDKKPSEWEVRRLISGDLGLLQGAQSLSPLVSATEYTRGTQNINLTAECLAIGPDVKTIFDNRDCGSANEANFRPPSSVLLVIRQPLALKETFRPGVYIFRVVVTDHVKGTSATGEQRFTYAPSGAAQTAPARSASAGPATSSVPPVSQGSIGAGFGTRDPVVCASTKEPVKGPISLEQAKLYFRCDREGTKTGPLMLVENLTLEMGKAHRPDRLDLNKDPDSLEYPIRGSYSEYMCYSENASPGILNNVGKNCYVRDNPNATGSCYRTTFGDWECTMFDSFSIVKGGRANVPPPR